MTKSGHRVKPRFFDIFKEFELRAIQPAGQEPTEICSYFVLVLCEPYRLELLFMCMHQCSAAKENDNTKDIEKLSGQFKKKPARPSLII